VTLPLEKRSTCDPGNTPGHRATAFGLIWQSAWPLPSFTPMAPSSVSPHITVRRGCEPLPERQPLCMHGNVTGFSDGFRYRADDEGTLDTFGDNRVDFRPGKAGKDLLPTAFFGTVAALLLAWRGCVPLHGTAVEIEGQAVLICGNAGAGKSTLAAGLIGLGARLISDDLSILHLGGPGNMPMLVAGRTTLRLHPGIACLLDRSVPWGSSATTGDSKLTVEPPRVDVESIFPLAAIAILDQNAGPLAESSKAEIMEAHLFRPFWTRRLLGTLKRRADRHFAWRHPAMFRVPIMEVRTKEVFARRAETCLHQFRQQLKSQDGGV
jgi:energy-coupling factor transporter ATP-binding protein EcfA2